MGSRKPSFLKTEMYDSILKDIMEDNYKQNKIIDERQLIEKYGVSKSLIRDASIELHSERALINHLRYGYEVVRINEEGIRDIVDFRIMIEIECLRDAASIMARGDIMGLRESTLTERSDRDKDLTVLKHWDDNSGLHLRLPSCNGNKYCYSMLQKSIGIITRAYTQRHWEKWGTISIRTGYENHLKVIDCLMDKDLERAMDELRRNIVLFLDILYPDCGNHIYM